MSKEEQFYSFGLIKKGKGILCQNCKNRMFDIKNYGNENKLTARVYTCKKCGNVGIIGNEEIMQKVAQLQADVFLDISYNTLVYGHDKSKWPKKSKEQIDEKNK